MGYFVYFYFFYTIVLFTRGNGQGEKASGKCRANKFGDFVPNKTYAQSGTTANVIENTGERKTRQEECLKNEIPVEYFYWASQPF